MGPKVFHYTIIILFVLVALMHLARLLFDWDFIISGWQVPMWLSWIAVPLLGYLAYYSFRLISRKIE